MNNAICPIWGTPAPPFGQYGQLIDSPRAGGSYSIERYARLTLNHRYESLGRRDESFCARLTTWLVDQRRLGTDCPEVTNRVLDDVERRRPLSTHERADRLLSFIHKKTPVIGQRFCFSLRYKSKEPDRWLTCETFARMQAWTEATKAEPARLDDDEVVYLLDFYTQKGLIDRKVFEPEDRRPGKENYFEYVITPEGHTHLEEMEKRPVDSKQAFVAMWFDESMKEAYEQGIKAAILDAGYEPLRIDRKEHNNKIDDEVIAEIRRSRFLIADFTSDFDFAKDIENPERKGARGSVYYEAGFAHGLNIPVIFTCREDVVDKAHFDTRQYNHITWTPKHLDKFRKALINRISATIVDDPSK